MALRTRSTFTVHWDPDPIVFGESIMDVHNALQTTYIPLSVIKEEVLLDIKERFTTRTGPDGKPWKPWAKSYEEKAQSYPNKGMLRRDDFLYNAVTDDDAIIVTNDTLFFNEQRMESIPPSSGRKTGQKRGYYHQEGTNNMPARPFLGLTSETRIFVMTSFEEWFNRAIELFPRKGGGIGRRHALRGIHPETGHKGFIPRGAMGPMMLRRR